MTGCGANPFWSDDLGQKAGQFEAVLRVARLAAATNADALWQILAIAQDTVPT